MDTRLTGGEGFADLLAAPPAVGWVVAALRHGHAGVGLIAVLALGGTLAVHEYLARVLIALVPATGRTLEAAAGGVPRTTCVRCWSTRPARHDTGQRPASPRFR